MGINVVGLVTDTFLDDDCVHVSVSMLKINNLTSSFSTLRSLLSSSFYLPDALPPPHGRARGSEGERQQCFQVMQKIY